MQANDLYFDVPNADGVKSTRFDMSGIAFAESRLQEVASVTSEKAQELLSFYNETWLNLDTMIKNLMREKGLAEAVLEEAEADALLACTDKILTDMGHKKASADLRKAYVSKRPEVIKAKEILQKIEITISVLRGKAQAFYNAHSDVKLLRDSGSLPRHPLGSKGMPEKMGGPKKQQPVEDPFEDDVNFEMPAGMGALRF